jgi:hypothetical protein
MAAYNRVGMGAQLDFVNDHAEPTRYQLDVIAANIIDTRRLHPEATVTLDMPARDRAQAVALMRLALSVLDPDER